MSEKKNLTLTYTCALIGGLLGLHHLYLGRMQHAFLWLTTLGGCGVGLIYELLFLISKYVQEANGNPFIIKYYQVQMIQRKSPSFEVFRLCGQFMTAVFYGFITYYAFPEAYHEKPLLSLFIGFCSALAIAFGTQLTGTIGPRRCSFVWPLLGAILGMPFLVWRAELFPSFNIPAFLSSWIFEWKIEWDPTYFSDQLLEKSSEPKRRKRRSIKHYVAFGLGVLVFSALFASAIYHNLQVDIKGRRVRVKDVLKDFLQSQELVSVYQQLANVARDLWTFYLKYGLKGLWGQIWMSMESESDRQAYEILHLRPDASQHQIESQCRTLPRQWHPDRYRNAEDKQKAQVIFISIQQACDRLSRERQRRQSLHTQL